MNERYRIAIFPDIGSLPYDFVESYTEGKMDLMYADFSNKKAYEIFVKHWSDQIELWKKRYEDLERDYTLMRKYYEGRFSDVKENEKLKRSLEVIAGISRKTLAQLENKK